MSRSKIEQVTHNVYETTKAAKKKNTHVPSTMTDDEIAMYDRLVEDKVASRDGRAPAATSEREPTSVKELVNVGYERPEDVKMPIIKEGMPDSIKKSMTATRKAASSFCPELSLDDLDGLIGLLAGIPNFRKIIGDALSGMDYGLLSALIDCIQRVKNTANDLGISTNMGLDELASSAALSGNAKGLAPVIGMAGMNDEYVDLKKVVRDATLNTDDEYQKEGLKDVINNPRQINPDAPDELEVVMTSTVPVSDLISSNKKVKDTIAKDTQSAGDNLLSNDDLVDGSFLTKSPKVTKTLGSIEKTKKDTLNMAEKTTLAFA